MTVLFWDASALAKRYVPEPGSDTVDALLVPRFSVRHVSAMIGYAETFSVILRCLNRGDIIRASIAKSVEALREEVLENPQASRLAVLPLCGRGKHSSLPMQRNVAGSARGVSALSKRSACR